MDFDRHATNYRAAFAEAALGVPVEKLAKEKARLILEVLASCVDDPKRLRVLDVGCGIGLIDQGLEREVAALCGVDTSLASLEHARATVSTAHFVHYHGGRLPFEDGSFDAVFASCVLHHVPVAERREFLAEMLRVLRPKGAVILIEHNPFNPVTRYIVSRCAFDTDAVLLRCHETMGWLKDAGVVNADRRYIGFSPLRHALIERAERMMGWLPLGAQYCAWGIKGRATKSSATGPKAIA